MLKTSRWLIHLGAYAIVVYLWLTPLVTFLFPTLSDHDVERALQLGLFAVVGVATFAELCIQPIGNVIRVRLANLISLGLLALLAFISTARVFSFQSWEEFALWCSLALCVTVVAIAAHNDYTTWIQWGCLLAGGTYALLLFILCLMLTVEGHPLLRTELFAGYSNYRFYNHVQTVLIPLIAVISLSPKLPFWARILATSTLAFNFALLFFSAGRATWVGLFVGCCVLALISIRRSRVWLIRMAAGMLIGGALYLLIFIALPKICGVSVDVSASEVAANAMSVQRRFYLWGLALADVREAPWLGIGPMQFAHRINTEAAHPHNFPLQVAAEWGVPILLLLLFVIFRELTSMAKAVRTERNSHEIVKGVGLLAACIAAGVDAMFSGNLVMPMSEIWIALTIGWAIAWTRPRVHRELIHTVFLPRSAVMFGAFALLVSEIFLVALVSNQLLNLNQYLDSVRTNIVRNDHDSPRFWSHGWF